MSSANISLLASFRRDLNEAKAVYISECNVAVNISLWALCKYDAPIRSQVSSNAVNY